MFRKIALLIVPSMMAFGCSPAGSSNGGRSNAGTDTTGTVIPDTTTTDTTSATGNLTGEVKCWNKMLETPAYQACKGQNKIYNRVKDVCVELGMTRTTDCSGIKETDIQNGRSTILASLPKAYITVDQCGTYTINGRTYAFAYLLGQRYFEDKNPEKEPVGYKYNVHTICYRPNTKNDAADNLICWDSSVLVKDKPPAMPANLGTCD